MKKNKNNNNNNNGKATDVYRSIKRKKFIVIVGIALVIAVITVTAATGSKVFLNSKPGDSSQAILHQGPQQPNPGSAKDILHGLSSPSTTNALALGSNTANVTLIEFGDYQCTYCHRFYKDTEESLLTNFVNTGKIRFLFKDFPINDLPSDRASTLASEASYCAADQGKYWEYHNELYNNWRGENTGWVTKDSLKQFANNVGIKDITQFSQCLHSNKYAGLVMGNYELAQSIGLNATPSFILLADGKQPVEIVGAQPYTVFENAIEMVY